MASQTPGRVRPLNPVSTLDTGGGTPIMASEDIPRQPGPPDPERDFDWASLERDLTASAEVSTGPDPASDPAPATRRDRVQDASFSVALDDSPEPGPYLAPPAPPGTRGEETRVPILPTWARSRAALQA